MKDISSLLKRFSNLLNKKEVDQEVVATVIEGYVGRKPTLKEIFIEGTVLEISTSPIIKNEIRLKEDKILEDLKRVHNIHISRVLYK
jgi:hypothetical protein